MTDKEAKRIENQLWEKAVSRYLDKIDWDISDWLSDKEWEVYLEARKTLRSA